LNFLIHLQIASLKDLRERTCDAVSLTAAIAAWLRSHKESRSEAIIRCVPRQGKEMVQLSADFNHMLDEISRRDTALVEARNQLEVRVIGRTSELEIEIAERERAQVAMQQSEEMFRTLSAAAPVGIAQLDAAGTEDWQDANPDQLIEEADVALYGAKESGRNRSVLAKPSGLQEIQISSLAEDKVPALITGMTRCAVT